MTDYNYYENSGVSPEDENWGSYQYVSLDDIINNFMLSYVGNDKLINSTERYLVRFHAKRSIQELNYDAFKETRIMEIPVCDSFRVVLPKDYVNWIRISVYNNGMLMPLNENIQSNYASTYLRDNECKILFDEQGQALEGLSLVDKDRLDGLQKSMYLGDGAMTGREGYFLDNRWYFDYSIGQRYGLNTETANTNPVFSIDKTSGVINFSSEMADQHVVIEYVSDGMEDGDDAKIGVNKMFEEFVYANIKYLILNNKTNTQDYIVRRSQKDKSALLRNARIRISNMKPGRLIMNMRGQAKQIK